MATVCKIARLAPKIKLCLPSRKLPVTKYIQFASISTSEKSKDTITIQETLEGRARTADPSVEPTADAQVDAKKNWISWGFSETDIVKDNTYMHMIMFGTVTLCLVGIGFIIMYMPDNRMIAWFKREAFLELRRREAEGLQLVDKDLIPEDKIELPSDEELGYIKIVI